MIKKLKSLNSKSIELLILAALLVAVLYAEPHQLRATSNNDNDDCRDKPFPQDIACSVGGAATGYDNGYTDGKRAGINDDSRSCPQSDGLSGYCLGWNAGYSDGADARRDMEQETGGNNNDGGRSLPSGYLQFAVHVTHQGF